MALRTLVAALLCSHVRLFTAAAAMPTTTPQSSASNAAAEAAALLQSMPECGQLCLGKAVAVSPCSPEDLACICSNSVITEQVEGCVLQSCTVREGLTTKNITSTLCQAPVRDQTMLVSYIGVIGAIVAIIAVILRVIARTPFMGGEFGLDDLIIVVAMVLATPLGFLSIPLSQAGLGKDIWTLPFDDITEVLHIYYFDEDCYLTALPLVKISILLFYNRIFPQRKLRIAVWVTIGVCAGYAIAFLLVSVFQCKPLSLAWTRWDEQHEGICNNINAQVWAAASINVLLDLVMVVLPLPVIWRLEINRRKKALVMVMFSIGLVVTAVSIVRLQVLSQFGTSSNFTWHYTSVGYWSTLETHLAIVCACLPAIRVLVMKAMPRTMGESTAADTAGRRTPATNLSESHADKKSNIMIRSASKDERDFVPLESFDTRTHRSNSDWSRTYNEAARQSYGRAF